MRRAANLFELIYEPENLRAAFHKAARGRRGQAMVSQFSVSLDECVAEISTTVREGTFPVGRYLCVPDRKGSGGGDSAGLALCPQQPLVPETGRAEIFRQYSPRYANGFSGTAIQRPKTAATAGSGHSCVSRRFRGGPSHWQPDLAAFREFLSGLVRSIREGIFGSSRICSLHG